MLLGITTQLSDRARQFADMLDIRVEESAPLGDYPRIKCHIARRNEARIYTCRSTSCTTRPS